MNYEKIKKFTKLILDIMFYSGIVVLITLPVWLKLAGKHYSQVIEEHYIIMLITFAAAGLGAIFIIRELRIIMHTVVEQDCFVRENVTSLRKMSKLSLCICVAFIIKLFFVPTPATLIIVLVFFVASLFSVVLSCVFQEAIDYKEENELTI